MRNLFAAALLATTPISATAMLIDNGQFTTDTVSGLDWLDVTETTYLSVFTVMQQVNGGPLDGWRIATGAEFDQLLTNGGLTAGGNVCPKGGAFCDQLGGESESVQTLVALLGDTYASSYTGTLIYLSGATRGYLADEELGRGFPYYYIAQISDEDFERDYAPGDVTYGSDYVYTHLWSGYEKDVMQDGGVFLVRATVVPAPAAAWLFGTALAGLGWIRRKQASTIRPFERV